MHKPNYSKMMAVIDEAFATRTDPNQLQVNQHDIEKLNQLHRACLNEKSNEEGPLIWCLIFPTTSELMEQFLAKKISETELLHQTPLSKNLDCIYLCSVSTLPEERGKGETKKLCLHAINEIRKDYPIQKLFV